MQQTRHARRLYVGGIPPGTTEAEVAMFFTEVIYKALPKGHPEADSPVIQVSPLVVRIFQSCTVPTIGSQGYITSPLLFLYFRTANCCLVFIVTPILVHKSVHYHASLQNHAISM